MAAPVKYVYQWRCNQTGMSYVGQGAGRRSKAHWSLAERGSSAPLHIAMRRHGRGAFELILLGVNLSPDQANALEISSIETLCCVHPSGYNRSRGGAGSSGRAGVRLTREHRERISAASRGVPKPPGFGAGVSARQSGVPHSPLRRAAISEARRLLSDAQIQNARILCALGATRLDCAQWMGVSRAVVQRAVTFKLRTGP